ncbi:MAG: GSCFA domain-containing protein [Patiriisocius sp.]|uniref:GSCFA domain-containing protein n=1 Tax=Patiriisocius sp. TaxID=2822396 RepID=UPI003EFA7299
MKLTTTIPLSKERNQIDYKSKVLLLGSCFAENIGEKLEYFKFQNLINPFGILFHPVAIEKLITRAINEVEFTEKDIFFQNEQWHCFEVHSSLSNADKDIFLSKLNTALVGFKNYIIEASHIILTLGTAWVYREISNDTVVANCHKIPQKKFIKELLSPDDVSDVLLGIEALIRDVNPNCTLIHTVSPVRHIKDGIVENSRSKAHLIAGTQEIVEPRKHNHYFPSFEIMTDELRDYRFYGEDLIHPNNTAISIIWEKFKTIWIASETEPLQNKIDIIQKGLQHRPFNPQSEGHIKFEKDLHLKISEVKERFPWIDF